MFETNDDLSEFLGEFHEVATIVKNGLMLDGIFDSAFQSFSDGLELTGPVPAILCRDTDVSTLLSGDDLLIAAVTYKVRHLEPDGTGMTQVVLKR